MPSNRRIDDHSVPGGHLAASYAVFWHEDFVSESLHVSRELLKPNGLSLANELTQDREGGWEHSS